MSFPRQSGGDRRGGLDASSVFNGFNSSPRFDDPISDGFGVWDSNYAHHHYGVAQSVDIAIAEAVIRTVGGDDLAPMMGKAKSLFEVGTAGVMRSTGLLTPLLDPRAMIWQTDVGKTQMFETMHSLGELHKGNLGIWESHQTAMGQVDPRWANAIAAIAQHMVSVTYHDVKKTSVPEVQVRNEAHALCSCTDKTDEYENGVENFLKSMTEGDVAVRLFDVNSNGYRVGDRWYPGYPINAAKVRIEARKLGLVVLFADDFKISQRTVGTEKTSAQSTLSGLGCAVLHKPFKTVHIDLHQRQNAVV
jgi:hypothetical protein